MDGNVNVVVDGLGCSQPGLHSRHCVRPLAVCPSHWFIFTSALWWCHLRKQGKMKITPTLKALPASHGSCYVQRPWPISWSRLSQIDLVPSHFASNFQICTLPFNSVSSPGVYFFHIGLFYCCFVYFVRMAVSIFLSSSALYFLY